MSYFEINGGKKLSGSITVNTSKNGTVALLAASMMNKGKTTFKNVPQIEEVNRWVEVLESIDVKIEKNGKDFTIIPPKNLDLTKIDREAAEKTRSIILLLGSLAGRLDEYVLPQAGGCRLGSRTVMPHVYALTDLGLEFADDDCGFNVKSKGIKSGQKVVLYESGDTVTENALFAAAQTSGETVIKFASANYMVQDVCFFLERLGVKIEGIGTTTLTVHGKEEFDQDVTYEIGEDPIEAMFFISLAISTKSEIEVKRCPIDFLELELLKLEKMGQKFELSEGYKSENGRTNLVDIKVIPSELTALEEKIYGRPFPGINMDNLPFFVPIAAVAKGRTLIHDWAFENRAIYFSELNRLGAQITLLDQHRVYVDGAKKLVGAEMVCPPALRPGAIVLVMMIAAEGKSTLRGIYPIQRGYENLEERLKDLGVEIELKN